VAYSDTDSLELTAAGTSGQFLKSNGAAAPTWESFSNVDHGSLGGLSDDDHTQYILVAGARAFTGDQSMGGFKLTNVATPTSGTDAANKSYVDAAINGLDWKASVRVATTAAGTLATSFENGDTVDGVTLATGDRILIKDQSTGSENGIYTVNASGAPTRATDADANAEVTAGLAVFVEEGTTNADTGWVLTTNNPITVGTTALTFAQFSGAGSITAGAGLTKTGNTIDFNAADTSLTVNADNVAVNLNTTGGLETSSGVRIKSNTMDANRIGITTEMNGASIKYNTTSFTDSGSETLALASTVAGSALTLTAGVLDVAVDNSTIEVSSDALRVKADGITNTHINSAANISLSKIEDFRTQFDWITTDGTSKAITHGFTTKDIAVHVYDKTDDSEILVDSIVRTSTTVVTLTSSEAPGVSGWRVLVVNLS
jgi:phage-related tail fiber protein